MFIIFQNKFGLDQIHEYLSKKGYVSIRFNEDGSLVTLVRDASGLITGSDLGKLAPDGRSGQFSAYMSFFPSLRLLLTF